MLSFKVLISSIRRDLREDDDGGGDGGGDGGEGCWDTLPLITHTQHAEYSADN